MPGYIRLGTFRGGVATFPVDGGPISQYVDANGNPTDALKVLLTSNAFVIAAPAFVRPSNTTAYASGDLVANNGTVVPLVFSNVANVDGDAIGIKRARITASQPLLTNASFRLHLFSTLPSPTVVDNAVFNSSEVLAVSSIASYLGYIDITLTKSGADGSWGAGLPENDALISQPVSGDLFGLLEARAAYVPTSGETFTVAIEGIR